MSIKDRISAFERGGQPTSTTSVPGPSLSGQSNSISRALAADSLGGEEYGSPRPVERTFKKPELVQRLPMASPRRDRTEVSSSSSASSSVFPPATSGSSSMRDPSFPVRNTSALPDAVTRPPPLPQRQATLPQTLGFAVATARPPPVAAKPAHLTKGQTPAASDLTLRTSALSSGGGDGDMITFSPIGPASSSPTAFDNDELPRATPRPAPHALPSRQSTISSVASLPPPLPSRKPTIPIGAPPNAIVGRRQPPPPPKPSQPALIKRRSAGSTPSLSPTQTEEASERYSALFTQLLALRRVAKMKRIMAGNDGGWSGTEERDGWLQSAVVRAVWNQSKLSPQSLFRIWCVSARSPAASSEWD